MPQLEGLDFPFYLEAECHTVPYLKALICGIEHTSGHRRGRTFTLQKVSWKNTHFAS